MSFQRTNSGISNLRLFHSVDFVVFVEGGPAVTAEAALNGGGTPGSSDVAFWQNVFRLRRGVRSIKFRAVGSKTTLLELAAKVASNEVRGIVVAMDQDYDRLSGKAFGAPGVIYTFGYSWENDVWGDPEVLAEVFYTVAPVCRATFAVSEQIEAAFKKFWSGMRRLVRADFACNQAGIRFFPKESPARLVLSADGAMPRLSRAGVKTCIQRAKAARQGRLLAGSVSVNPRVDCHGHLVEYFGYRCIYQLARGQAVKSLPLDLVRGIAIEKFGAKLRSVHESPVKEHYLARLRQLRMPRSRRTRLAAGD